MSWISDNKCTFFRLQNNSFIVQVYSLLERQTYLRHENQIYADLLQKDEIIFTSVGLEIILIK